jgi:WD40 repeat protein
VGTRPEVWVVIPTPDGKFALAGENTGKIVLWDVDNKVVKATCKDGDERVAALAWRPVGAPTGTMQFVSGHEDGKAVLWQYDPTANPMIKMVRQFPHDNRDEPVNSVAVSPNGKVLVSAGFERIARVWNLTNAAPITKVEDFEDRIWRVAICPDGKKFATASQDGTVRLFRLSSGEEFPGQTGFDQRKTTQWGAMGVDFLNNTRIIYTTGDSGRQHFDTWDIPGNWPPGPPPP